MEQIMLEVYSSRVGCVAVSFLDSLDFNSFSAQSFDKKKSFGRTLIRVVLLYSLIDRFSHA